MRDPLADGLGLPEVELEDKLEQSLADRFRGDLRTRIEALLEEYLLH